MDQLTSLVVWTPLTGIWYFGWARKTIWTTPGKRRFELHLLESGISGWGLRWLQNICLRLNSTYWNLVFRDGANVGQAKILYYVWTPLTGIWYFGSWRWECNRTESRVWTPLTGIWYFGLQRWRGRRLLEIVWTPLTGIWYFGESSKVGIVISGSVWTPLTGIWYFGQQQRWARSRTGFVWTPLTGIWYFGRSQGKCRASRLPCLNSTYWNLVFRVTLSLVPHSFRILFELHLLESGISG